MLSVNIKMKYTLILLLNSYGLIHPYFTVLHLVPSSDLEPKQTVSCDMGRGDSQCSFSTKHTDRS